MDLQHVQRCMEQVAACRATGLKAKVWAEANGVPLGTLGGWCAHYRRWQAKLDGGAAGADPATSRPSGFVAARVASPAPASSVRIELNCAASRLELHWPLAHARELAVVLRELGR